MKTPEKQHVALTHLYENLSRSVQFFNWLKFGDRFAGFTMHKTLLIPDHLKSRYTRQTQAHYTNDLAFEFAAPPENPQVLDVGCGFGGTIFRWQSRIGGEYDGFTISARQVRYAQHEARQRGIDRHVRFYLRDFDQPIEKSYQVIIAIETLIHSPNFHKTVENLAGALLPGGKLVIVDDLRVDGENLDECEEFRILQKRWFISRIPSKEEYQKEFARHGLKLVHAENLTSQVQLPDVTTLQKNMRRLKILEKLLSFAAPGQFISTQIGGLALQHLYLQGKLRYFLLVAEKAG